MQYVVFVATTGAASPEQLSFMQAGWPAWEQERDRGGIHPGIGRELVYPPNPATVRERAGQRLVTDGPFAELKEYIGGFELIDAAGLEQAIAVESANPVLRACAFELRPVAGEVQLAPGVRQFAGMQDQDGRPYLLTVWSEDAAAADVPVRSAREVAAWRRNLERSGQFVLGAGLQGPHAATTLRHPGIHDPAAAPSRHAGPFTGGPAHVAGVEVIRAGSRDAALAAAGTHPRARAGVIEVEAFYVEGDYEEPGPEQGSAGAA